ncbi:MAG: tetratricopeptide repeat protein [Cyanobacteria bacterium SZAS TMP-1]|nr:tetratricopeptide repeat protein [Cyanobacteria bacterium SZAS TMP-1]
MKSITGSHLLYGALCACFSWFIYSGPALASDFSPSGCASYARNRQWNELADYTRRWTQAQPGNAEAWYSLGNACGSSEHKFGLQQPEKAVAAYRQAVKLNPRLAKAWNALGHAAFESGDRDQALAAFKKATELEPGNARYWNSLGSVHGMGHNPNDAAATAAYKRAESLGSKDATRNNAIIHTPVRTTNAGWNAAPQQGGFRPDPYFLHQNPVTGAPLLNPTTGQRQFQY